MKQILDAHVVAAHWDSGQPDTYRVVFWDFETMKPVSESVGVNPAVDLTDTLAMKCYKRYLRNTHQASIRECSILETNTKAYIGDTVRVYCGRKAPVGFVGEIISINDYGYGEVLTIRDDKHEHKAYKKNCDIIAVRLDRKPWDLQPLEEYPPVTELDREIFK